MTVHLQHSIRFRLGGVVALSLAIFLGGTSSDCFAWSAPGHQIVGATADELLKNTRAEREVRRILGGMDLKTASVWADCVRGVSRTSGVFTYSSSDDAYPECSAFGGRDWTLRMINYARANWNECGLASGSEMCHSQFHYTDVSTFDDAYRDGEKGTSEVDIVHAIPEAIRVLKGVKDSPELIKSRKMLYPTRLEALLALTHFVGDIHQPLHVTAVYLDANGKPVNPEQLNDWKATSTTGGNFVSGSFLGVKKMNWHTYWDSIPEDFVVGGPGYHAIVDRARQVPVSSGDASGWARIWADDTINAGKPAFAGLTFAPEENFDPKKPAWTVQHPDGYEQTALQIKREQLARAGARLAQVLQAIWPEEPVPCDAGFTAKPVYLDKATISLLTHKIPPAPRQGSAVQLADEAAFESTRATMLTPRGRVAAHDDVYLPNEVLPRFQEALGIDLERRNLQPLYDLLAAARNEADQVMNPVKQPVCAGGRVRPFVAHPVAPACPSLVVTRFDDRVYDETLIAQWQLDLNHYHLGESGSYPSGHAMTGELFANVLAEIFPERAKQIHRRGLEFGESRLVCGFHYPSDLKAGREVADAVFVALMANQRFRAALNEVKSQFKGP